MVRLSVLASITDPGRPDLENEDRLGWSETAAFVIDGATSLGDPVVHPPRSDAAWFAEHAAAGLRSGLVPGRATAGVVREVNATARERFSEAARGKEIERYRHPTAGFQTLRVDDDGVEVAGLSDCVLFLKDAAGTSLRWSALGLKRSREKYFARKALDESGGFDRAGVAFHAKDVLSGMRSGRAKHNMPGGSVWTLGLEPMAADYIKYDRPKVVLPALALLCTDGFADLIDAYERYTIDSLIAAAETSGLEGLVAELRDIERRVDPEGVVFPRFKQSDDASALLLRLDG